MTRAQSMDVINDSTTMQSRIDAALSAPIMEWDHSPEILWQPGDPIYAHPHERTDWHRALDVEGVPYTFQGGNHVRHMIEIVGLHDRYLGQDENDQGIWEVVFLTDDTFDGRRSGVRCQDCQVGWGADTENCWICGKYAPRPVDTSVMSWDSFRVAAEDSVGSIRRISEHMRGLSVNFTTYDDFTIPAWRGLSDFSFFGDFNAELNRFYGWHIHTYGRRSRRSGLSAWFNAMVSVDERNGPADTTELVRVRVLQEDVDRLYPTPRVLDREIDLGLPASNESITDIGDRMEDAFGGWAEPRAIETVTLYIPPEIPRQELLVPERVLDVAETLVRTELLIGMQYPTSNTITQQRRRRNV